MKKLNITVLGKTYEVLVEDMGEVSAEKSTYTESTLPPVIPVAPVERSVATEVTAPMSGTVVDIAVSVGDVLEAGAPLLTLEAMKMQNVIPAPKDGTVREILVRKGDTVSNGAPMFILD